MGVFKKITSVFAALLLAALPMAALAQTNVQIEATTKGANTTHQGGYQEHVRASLDQVVAIQVWYHNKEEAKSGKVANNLKVKINVPNKPGKDQVVSSTVSSDNSNTVNSSTRFTMVSQSLEDRMFLEYIPGSAQWRHNAGTNENPRWVTEKISTANEKLLVNGGGLRLENAQPCFNFEATVTILARVKAPVVSITKQVRKEGGGSFVNRNSAKPGDTLQYVIRFKNEGNTVLQNIVVGDNMPPYMTYVPGSTVLVTSNTGTQGRKMPDGVTTRGITVGDLAPGGVGYVYLKLKLDRNIPNGDRVLKNVGTVRPAGMNQFFNVAETEVNVKRDNDSNPTPQAAFDCESLKVEQVGGKDSLKYKFTAKATASNTNVTGYIFDFGDGKTETKDSTAKEFVIEHTYATKPNPEYKPTVRVRTDKGTTDVKSACRGSITAAGVTPPTPTPPTPTPPTPTPATPASLPQTGMEGVAAAGLGSGALGYSVRAYLRSKRSLLDALKGITSL